MRELQRLPARMSDRRRHGEDEDRSAAPSTSGARTRREGSVDCQYAAVGAGGGASAWARQPSRTIAGLGGARAALSDRQRSRPLCCGRTYLAAGMVDEAKREARRMLAALAPFVLRGTPIVGLEPACLLSLRDEYLVMGLGDGASRLSKIALLIEEFLAREEPSRRLAGVLRHLPEKHALLHGH